MSIKTILERRKIAKRHGSPILRGVRRFRSIAATAALGSLLMACGPKYDYPNSFKDSFMSNCLSTSGGQVDYCECALAFLEDNVPYSEALEGAGISEAIDACAGETD